MQLISWLMLGCSISQTSGRQTLWVQWAMNQDLPLPHSTFCSLLSLLSLPFLSLSVLSFSTSQYMFEDVAFSFDNNKSFRSQELF